MAGIMVVDSLALLALTCICTLVAAQSPTAAPTTARNPVQTMSRVCGNGNSGYSTDGGRATSASLTNPRGLWQDSVGYIYVADTGQACVRRFHVVDTIMSSYAGKCGTSGYVADGVPATSGGLVNPLGLGGDTAGRFIIADAVGNRVRAVSSTGIITTYAGATSGTTANNIPATSAAIGPTDVWMNSLGVLFINDYSAVSVRCVSLTGIVVAVAGTLGGTGSTGDGGAATSARLNSNERMTGDSSGGVYVSDSGNHVIRKVSPSGIIDRIAGVLGQSTTMADGPALTTSFNYPTAITVDGRNGDVYFFPRFGYKVYVCVAASGLLVTAVGTGSPGSSGDGGPSTDAAITNIEGMFMDTSANLYMADYNLNTVRLSSGLAPSQMPSLTPTLQPIAPSVLPTLAPTGAPTRVPSQAPSVLPTLTPTVTPTHSPTTSLAPSTARRSLNTVSLVAGTGSQSTSGDGGRATAASFNQPRGLWQDSLGTTYIGDQLSYCVRKFAVADTIVSTYAGSCGTSLTSGDGGPATSGSFTWVFGVFVDSAGKLFVADSGASRVRLVSASGILSTFAGTGVPGGDGNGGAASSATVNCPVNVWANTLGVVYVNDFNNYQVRSVSVSGIMASFTGTFGVGGSSGDGGPVTSARLSQSERLVGDTAGMVYIADSSNHVVRRVDLAGIIDTFAGIAGVSSFSGVGQPATSTSFNYPAGLAVDPSNGDVYINARLSFRVLVRTGSTGLVSTFAGTGSSADGAMGSAATTTDLIQPECLFLDTSTNLYVLDWLANKLKVVTPYADPTVAPTRRPTVAPTTRLPSAQPSANPTVRPSRQPSKAPTAKPTVIPTTCNPSVAPSVAPTAQPTTPTMVPTITPTTAPSVVPTFAPTAAPSITTAPITASPTYKVTNALAFAAITSDQSVVCWGAAASGGDCSSVTTSLISSVVASKNAFAALKSDGGVVAWGAADDISGWTAYQSYSTIVSLVATEKAFAGVTSGGGVIAFGAHCCGGDVNQYGWASQLTSGVRSVHASSGAFAAVKWDGSVYTWGSAFAGGGVSSATRSDLSDIVMVSASRSAFAGLTHGGSVVAWGGSGGGTLSSAAASALASNAEYVLSGPASFVGVTAGEGLVAWGPASAGGDSSSASVASDVTFMTHTSGAWCAVKSDWSFAVWGNSAVGGDPSSVSASLSGGVSSVVGNLHAFAAVSRLDGRVVAWGSSTYGGQLNSVVSGVASIAHTNGAFAALKSDGSVVTWGAESFGGTTSSAVSAQLTSGVRLLCANDVAFTAIKTDGSAVAWGYSHSVNSGILAGSYLTVTSC